MHEQLCDFGGIVGPGSLDPLSNARSAAPYGDVVVGAATSSVPTFALDGVVRAQIQPGARCCYQRGLEHDPNQRGALVLLLRLTSDGGVASATTTKGDGLSSQVAACVTRVARSAKLDAPGASGAHITVPLAFSPRPPFD
jgi:hypothetical protein